MKSLVLTARSMVIVAAATFAAAAHAQVLMKDLPPPIQGLEVVEHLGQKIPLDLPFVDSTGKPTTLARFFNDNNKPVILAMVYFRCPMQCRTVLSKLALRINDLDLAAGDKFNVVTVSFDPTEGPEKAAAEKMLALAGYEREHPKSLDASWEFLTSPGDSARKLADAVGFPYRYLPESNEYSHVAVIFVLAPDGRISRYLYGSDYPYTRLRLALLEASDGKIGSTVDRIINYCFHWDPSSGTYTVQAMRVMQIGGAMSVTAIAGLFFGMWLVERRRRRHVAGSAPTHTTMNIAGGGRPTA